jgi:phospholipid transport system substrate-binding protein
MKKISKLILFLLSTIFISGVSVAGELRDLIDENSKQLLTQIQENREEYRANPEKLSSFVKESIADYFHFSYMSRFAAGRYWRKMSKEQQKEYNALFIDLLIKTYASAMLDFNYADISFEDEKKGRKKNRFHLIMRAKSKGNKFRVDYEIAKTKKGPKVINVKLEGVSLLINYRKSFGSILSKDGPDALIEFIKKSLKGKK